MEHEQEFKRFLSNHVNLNQDRLDKLRSRVDTITDISKAHLPGYVGYSEQGSYAHGTIIKPVKDNDEFDADILVFIRDHDFDPNSFKKNYVDEIYKVFKEHKTYEDKVTRNTRCIVIDYAGDFKLDVVPCVQHDGMDYITNKIAKQYEPTDGDGYKGWLKQKNEIVGGNNFKKTTRLLKFLRDHKSNFSVKSILLTTLLGNMVQDNEDSSTFEDLPTTLLVLSCRLDEFLQNRSSMPTIYNPVLPNENFNRHWDETKYDNFRDKFESYSKQINQAFHEKDYNKSIIKWRGLFGDNFGKLMDISSSKKIDAVPPIVRATKPFAHDDQILK